MWVNNLDPILLEKPFFDGAGTQGLLDIGISL